MNHEPDNFAPERLAPGVTHGDVYVGSIAFAQDGFDAFAAKLEAAGYVAGPATPISPFPTLPDRRQVFVHPGSGRRAAITLRLLADCAKTIVTALPQKPRRIP